MIGWYVHHQGRGHLHRALAVGAELGEPVTVLSSLERPPGHVGEWVRLDRDDRGGGEPSAGGRLHWAPLRQDGLRRRMHQVSGWLERARPRLVVADVSVEIALLARLHGVPVASVLVPGRRDDAAHRLGFDVSDRLVAAWPSAATAALLPGLDHDVLARVRAVGGLSRFPVAPRRARRPGPPRALVMGGAGDEGWDADLLRHAVRSAQDWEWLVCGPPGPWCADPYRLVRDADVVVTHAGQNALAEVAAARRPAVVVPRLRPHDEQHVAAAALRDGGWPVVVEPDFPSGGWRDRLHRVSALDGAGWGSWCDGGAARRFAHVLSEAA
jgi:glycosyl transferase family 28